MPYETITLEEFHVIGIAVKTTNQNGQSQKDIGGLWENFFRDGIANKIPDKESNDIYCIYTDYESDFNGPYTTILGCKVSSLQNIPEGFAGKTIPKAKFQLYKSTGKLPETVMATWIHVWQSSIERSYIADFDVYSSKSKDPNNTDVETYVSIN